MGGISALLECIVYHKDDEVRKLMCQVFTAIVADSKEIQKYARRLGAVNLVMQAAREQEPRMFDVVLSAFASFIKGNNIEG